MLLSNTFLTLALFSENLMPYWIIGGAIVFSVLLLLLFMPRKTASKQDDGVTVEPTKTKVTDIAGLFDTPNTPEKTVDAPADENALSEDANALEDDLDEDTLVDDAMPYTPAMRVISYDERTGLQTVARYRKLFEARLYQTSLETKRYYSTVKNQLLSYEGVTSKIRPTEEAFFCGKTVVARINVRQKVLELYLPVASKMVAEAFNGRDVGEKKKYETTPYLVKVTGEKTLADALELLATACADLGLAPIDAEPKDYVSLYAYKTTEELVRLGLIMQTVREEKQTFDFEWGGETVKTVETPETAVPSQPSPSQTIPDRKAPKRTYTRTVNGEQLRFGEDDFKRATVENGETEVILVDDDGKVIPPDVVDWTTYTATPVEGKEAENILRHLGGVRNTPDFGGGFALPRDNGKNDGDARVGDGTLPSEPNVKAVGTQRPVVNEQSELIDLSTLENQFADGDTVDLNTLKKMNVVSGDTYVLKVRSSAVLHKSLTVVANYLDTYTVDNIRNAGGYAIKII